MAINLALSAGSQVVSIVVVAIILFVSLFLVCATKAALMTSSLCVPRLRHTHNRKPVFHSFEQNRIWLFVFLLFALRLNSLSKSKKQRLQKLLSSDKRVENFGAAAVFSSPLLSAAAAAAVSSYENAHWGTPTAERLGDTVHLSCGSTLRTPSMTQWTAPALATALRAL